MASKHAILSASGANWWINCTKAPRFCENIPETPSEYAKQGTEAHTLCEYKLRKLLGEKVRDPSKKLTMYDNEMEEAAEGYSQFVYTLAKQYKEENPDTLVYIEQRVDFSNFVPEGFGTADALIISGSVVTICDFKYGKGIEVSAERNPQMMLYALGAIQMFGNLYDIEEINLIIYQPRLDNLSQFQISKNDLVKWALNTLIPAAELAYAGKGEFKAGEHCRFCRAKATCRKRVEYNLELAKYDFEMPDNLENTEIAAILEKADALVSWVGDIKDYALQQALSGAKFDGFKVVEGRSNRKYKDETQVANIVKKAGYEPYEPKLLGITAMTSLLGKTKFEELLGEFVVKPQGKPVLVGDEDKRPEFNPAISDFKEEV